MAAYPPYGWLRTTPLRCCWLRTTPRLAARRLSRNLGANGARFEQVRFMVRLMVMVRVRVRVKVKVRVRVRVRVLG